MALNDRQRTAAFVATVALATAGAYFPAVHFGWVWDDVNLVQPSPALQDLAGLRRATATDLYRQAAPRLESSPYWRPLALASFWLDTRLGSAPRALHVGNILLHAMASALLALVLRRRLGSTGPLAAPALAAAWWAFHPENVEAVAWISCRYDLLCGVALLGLLALPWRPGAGRAALHGLLFLSGLLSKDGFGAMAPVVVAMDWSERRAPAVAAPRWLAVGLALAAWYGARVVLRLPGFGLPAPDVPLGLSGLFLEAARIYFVRAIVPPPLTIDHPYASAGALGLAIGAAVLLGLAAAVAWRRRFAVPVAIYAAGLVPTAVAMAKFGEIPERYSYVPSIGLALLVGDLVAACLRSQRVLVRLSAPVAVGLVTLIGFARLEARLPDWRSGDALFAAALQVDPEDAQANLHRAIEAGRRRDWGEARRTLEIAQRSDPSSARIAGAFAWVLLQSGDAAGAIGQAERATAAAPYQPDGWYYLALARHVTGDHRGELSAIEKILELSPTYPGAGDAREVAACEVSGRTDCAQAARRAGMAR